MTRDRTDRLLQSASYAIALVRVLRGEDPAEVVRQTQLMTAKANELRQSIKAHSDRGPRGNNGSAA